MQRNTSELKDSLLIIDSNEVSLDLADALLRGEFTIFKAQSEQEALKILDNFYLEINCILLDVNLPKENENELLDTLKKSKKYSNIPVIILTSNNSKEDEYKFIEKGAIDFITKPFDSYLLKRRIKNIINLHESFSKLKVIEKDELTGVYSRSAFYVHAADFLEKQTDYFDLVISDITYFKALNEKVGEKISDDVLRYTAEFIRENIAYENMIGRYGSDKFVMLVKKGYAPTNIFIESMLDKYTKNAPVRNLKCKFGVYENINKEINISLCASYVFTSLKKIANDYERNTVVFDEQARNENARRIKLTDTMEDGIKNEDFKVYIQPKHETVSGKLIGGEALIRWQHPEYGMISPGEFIPLFESNGFVPETDFFVWRKTCEYLRKWIDEGIKVVPISVNASKLDFEVENFYEILTEPVERLKLNPNLLHIEVTETMENRDVNILIEMLSKFRDYGFRVELDDFGSGYSSLNILGSLPLDIVKIDQAFIRQIHDPRKARILSSCISLTKNLGLVSVCEGVETEEQRNVLKSIGCDRIQGYYFAKPMPAEEFKQYLIDQSKKEVELDFTQYGVKSSAYTIDKDFTLINFNSIAKDNFPGMEKGKCCYKTMYKREEPCLLCPIINDQKGPKTVIDMAHNRFMLVDGTNMPIGENEDGYLVTVGYTKNLL